MEIQGSSSLYNENVDNYSEPLKKDDLNIVNLHGIHDSRKRFYSYTFKDDVPQPSQYSDDIILNQRKQMDESLAKDLFQNEMTNRMKSSGFYRKSSYLGDSSGMVDNNLYKYSVLMLNLRDKIIEKLIAKGVIREEYETFPKFDRKNRDGSNKYLFYVICDYMRECSDPVGLRAAQVNAVSEAKFELGGIYNQLQISPSFPYGMPAQDATYNDEIYVETGKCGHVGTLTGNDHSDYNKRYYPSDERVRQIQGELPLVEAEYQRLTDQN